MRSSKSLQKKGKTSRNSGTNKNSTVAKSSNSRTPIRSSSRKRLRNNEESPYSRKKTEFLSPSENYSSDIDTSNVLFGSPSRCKERPVKLNKACYKETTGSYKEEDDTRRFLLETKSNISANRKVVTRSSSNKRSVDMKPSKTSNSSVTSKKRNIGVKNSFSKDCMDVPSYQEVLNNKKDCDKYIHKIQQLAEMVVPIHDETSLASESNKNTPNKIFQSTRYNTCSRMNSQPSLPICNACEDAKPRNSNVPVPSSHKEKPRSIGCQNTRELKSNMEPSKNKENEIDAQANLNNAVALSTGRTKCKLNFEIEPKQKESYAKSKGAPKPKKFKRNCSESYSKYGICMPSHQDMINQKHYCDNYSDMVQNLMDLVVPLPQIPTNPLTSQTCEVKALNCKSITRHELIAAYKNNIGYLEDIIDGKISNERHEKFKRVATREELTFNTSMIAFTNKQKQTLVKRLCRQFGDTSYHSDYYFKVLLPELCLKIFMDVHSMSQKEATEYLENYPIEV